MQGTILQPDNMRDEKWATSSKNQKTTVVTLKIHWRQRTTLWERKLYVNLDPQNENCQQISFLTIYSTFGPKELCTAADSLTMLLLTLHLPSGNAFCRQPRSWTSDHSSPHSSTTRAEASPYIKREHPLRYGHEIRDISSTKMWIICELNSAPTCTLHWRDSSRTRSCHQVWAWSWNH
jgi:hypothetical protein